ncbi:MAG: hypothetical protein HOL70_01310 [Candidatus Marinimicrobia bacterium]|nr:hypothetical protein [Candidatus Neomarinimicrobiota bacterium]
MNDKGNITSKAGSSGWHLAMKRAHGDKPYIGDREEVEKLVKGFIGHIFRRYDRVHDGEMTQQMMISSDQAACHEMGAIFSGKSDDYTTVGDWNDGGGLARHMRRELNHTMDTEVDDNHMVAQFFGLIVHSVYHIIGRLAQDDESAHDTVKELVENATNILLGLPGELPQ